MKKAYLCATMFLCSSTFTFATGEATPKANRPATFCNPLDLNYRFQTNEPSRREAADPTMVRFKDEYWLFASKSGGYWHTKDFSHWDFVVPQGLPLEAYAPTVEVINGKLYFTAGGVGKLFTTDDPAKGEWTKVADFGKYNDPALFVDDDSRVYMYAGTSDKKPITGVELDPKNNFGEIGQSVDLLTTDPIHRGWELKKLTASNEEIQNGKHLPFLEGAWMTKHNGIYYLQYGAPGTEKKFYADGVFISEHPLGPFRYMSYNPFTLRPGGFIGGTGHGSIFQHKNGSYWHAETMLVGVRAGFERRLGLFPTGFVPNGSEPAQIVSSTYLGDYPQYLPGQKPDPLKANTPGWMLLSYKKPTKASSAQEGHLSEDAVDENVQTWWSAATGNPGEWLSIDLGKSCQIESVQINFADEGASAFGRTTDDVAYKYELEVSDDEKNWRPCISRKDNKRDAPHEYVQLDQPIRARYIRIINVHTPFGAAFSISGLRLFGSGLSQPPSIVKGVTAQRLANRRLAKVAWDTVANADFYIVRYGIAPDRLFLNCQVHNQNTLALMGLNTDADYFVTVDAVNDSGVTMGTQAVAVKPGN